MIKLKHIKLINFCGYRNFERNLSDENGIKKWQVLFGPNGSFKSSFLDAVRMLSTPRNFVGRDNTLLFRKLTYHPNYQPGIEGFDNNKTEMEMEGIFGTDEGDKKVIIRNNWIPEQSGVIVNELQNYNDCSVYIDADNPLNSYRFQLVINYKDIFLDIAREVYGLECDIPTERKDIVIEYDEEEGKQLKFCTDFVITKYSNTKVHFKRMSGGEKKIATVLRFLMNKCYNSGNRYNIILIDNIEKEIYYKRHMKLIYKLQEHFPEKQFIITTHSPVIINEMDKKYLMDMEECLKGIKK